MLPACVDRAPLNPSAHLRGVPRLPRGAPRSHRTQQRGRGRAGRRHHRAAGGGAGPREAHRITTPAGPAPREAPFPCAPAWAQVPWRGVCPREERKAPRHPKGRCWGLGGGNPVWLGRSPPPRSPTGRGGLHQYFTREADGLPAPRVAQELGPGAGGQLPDRPCHASSCPESHHPKPLAGLEAAPGAPPPFLARAWGALSPPGHRSGLPSRASPAPAACRALPRVGVSCTPSAHAPRHAGARTQAQRRKRAVACACTRRASPGDSPKRRHRSQGGGGGLSRGGGG